MSCHPQITHSETLEEAGVKVVLKGIVRIEYQARDQYNRMRVIFYAGTLFISCFYTILC